MKKLQNNFSDVDMGNISIPNPKDNQSVRSTFVFWDENLELFEKLLDHFNTKPKALLGDWFQRLSLDKLAELVVLPEIKNSNEQSNYVEKKGFRKTIVLTNAALKNINEVSKKWNLSRNILFNAFIVFLNMIVEKSIKEQKQQAQRVLEIVDKLSSFAEDCESDIKNFLDKDDPIIERMGTICVLISNLQFDLEHSEKTGEPVSSEW